MKRKSLFLIFFVVVVVLVAYGFVLVRHGFSAKDQPSSFEKFLARTMRDLAIPRSASEQKNPWGNPAPPEALFAGRTHWADHCATCHGNDGSGNTLIGQNLYPKAPDMRLAATQNLTDGELYYIIVNGVRMTGMPAWGLAGSGKEDENWHLVSFIRHLPSITPAELDEMKELNPKTEADRAEEQQEQEFLNGREPSESPQNSSMIIKLKRRNTMKARVLVLAACISMIAGAAWAHGGEEHVIGTVAKVDQTSIIVKTAANKMVTVAVLPQTTFSKAKVAMKLGDLKVGDRVVIHAKEPEEGKLVGDTVEFSSVKPKPTNGVSH